MLTKYVTSLGGKRVLVHDTKQKYCTVGESSKVLEQ